MQDLLASLVISMNYQEAGLKAGLETARAEARKTGQEFDTQGERMGNAIQRAAVVVNDAAQAMMAKLTSAGRAVRDAGLVMTAALTVPIGLAGKSAKDTASDFESAMGKVEAAMIGVSPEHLQKLSAAALEMGPAVGRSAIEAAGAIEALAKNGLSAADILGGGLKSALTLAVVGETDLSNAANLTTDIMAQFGKTAGDLPKVVDRVAGALDKSKMAFNDYRLAAGEAGGVVGSLGYQFEDFNVGLAAIAPQFSSGSVAGTSFVSFLMSLNAKSEDSLRVMNKLGLAFYNADGSARSLGEIAQQLKDKLGNLTDKPRGDAITKMFGVEGFKAATELMKSGLAGIEEAKRQIDTVTADQKTAVLLEGEAAATERVAGAWEHLKIVVGNAGIIQVYTAIKEAIASTLSVLASGPPWFYQVGVAVAALVAATGPLVVVLLTLAKMALPLLLLRLGPVALGLAAIINPFGVLIRLLGQLALQAGAATLLGALGRAMIGFAGPIGVAITLLSIFGPLLFRTGQASDAAQAAQAALTESQEKGAATAIRLATATGKAREEALAQARADRAAAAAAIAKAKADMAAARAAYARAKMAVPKDGTGGGAMFGDETTSGLAFFTGRRAVADTGAELKARIDGLRTALTTFDGLDAAIKTAESAGTGPKINMDFGDDPKSKKNKGASGKSAADLAREAARNDAQYLDELGRLRVEQLQATADLNESARSRHTAELAAIAEEKASFARQVAGDEGLTATRRETLIAEQDRVLSIRAQIAEQKLTVELAQEGYDLARTRNDAEQEYVRAQIDLVDSAAGRRAGELRLLDLQRQQEEADLDLILATKATSSAEWSNAEKRKGTLDGIYAQKRESTMRSTAGPGESFLQSIRMSGAALQESLQDVGVSALQGLNTELAAAGLNVGKLSQAFTSMGQRVIQSLIQIALQQKLIKPLAEALFGSSEGGSGGGGFFAKIAGMVINNAASKVSPSGATLNAQLSRGNGVTGPSYGGGRATGGGIKADHWYDIGERGPERFYPGVTGTVVPVNDNARASRGAPVSFDLRGVVMTSEILQQMQTIANETSGRMVGSYARGQARISRNTR